VPELARWAVIIGIIAAELRFLIDVGRFYNRRRHPFVLLYALRSSGPGFPLFAFPLATWWVLHSVLAILAAIWFEQQITFALTGASLAEIGVGYLTLSAVVFAASHASLLHLLLVVRSSGASPRVVQKAWPWRALIDLGIVVVTVLSVNPQVPLGVTRVGQILRNFGVNI
jgi:hypothetical protein